MPKKVLVITASVGYPASVGGDFTKALKATGFAGDVAVLSWERGPLPFLTERVCVYRQKVLQSQDAGYDTIITTDLRDVLFQGNPEGIEHTDLDLFLEDDRMKIKDCPWNSSWVRSGWGQEGLDLVGDNRVSCAGVVIGKRAGVLAYYEKMWAMCCAGYGHVVDQGIHNYLIWTGQLAGVPMRLVGNEDGEVYTVQYVDGITVRNHKIYNRGGKAPTIVHQYDRHLAKL